MRAAIAIGLLVLATTTVGGAGDAAAQVLGFDHIVHDGRITVLGRPSLDCTSCHPITATGALVGRPGHKACLGACHTWTPRPGVALAEELVEVCATCHDPEALTRPKPPVAFPPYVLEPDYPMTLSHAKHAGARCEQCHTAPGAKAAAPRPHARCTSCHGSTATPMTACTTCHIAAYGANALPRLVRGPLSVGAAYSHARHASRTPAEAVGCAACHASISTADGLELTPPTAMQCATGGCHDGPRAFSITERCTSCHTTAPRTRFDVARPDARFSHDAHASRLALDDCAACHGLDGRGEPVAGGHAACASCHAADFGAAQPTICGACHGSTEPWRALVVDRLPASRSEFGARLNHTSHAAVPCARCHTLTTATRELRPARGHAACSGAGCHAGAKTAGAPEPTLDACAACHALGLERARVAERTAAPWTVRARFRHDAHATDAAGAPLGCATCHDGVATSTDAATLPTPQKPACAPCHDGKRAFKMTGHGCARCHGT